jgi:hypothetical protein
MANKITNTYTAPAIDYGLSGLTDSGSSVGLTTNTDAVVVFLNHFEMPHNQWQEDLPSIDLGSDWYLTKI